MADGGKSRLVKGIYQYVNLDVLLIIMLSRKERSLGHSNPRLYYSVGLLAGATCHSWYPLSQMLLVTIVTNALTYRMATVSQVTFAVSALYFVLLVLPCWSAS